MSAITKEFTKEQLQQIIETDHVQCGEASSLARIALASLEAEAVDSSDLGSVQFEYTGAGDYYGYGFYRDGVQVDVDITKPLYTAPPEPVSVHEDEQYKPHPVMAVKGELGFLDHFDRIIGERDEDIDIGQLGSSNYEALLLAALDAFRAAMLQGVDRPQNEPQNIPENIPATQFKPVADLYGLTSPTGGETSFTFDAVEARDFIDGGWSCQEYVELERFQEAITNHTEDKLAMVDHSGDSNNMVEPVTTAYKLPPHVYRELVNSLRDTAVKYQGCQQLREQISETLSQVITHTAHCGNSPVIPEGWVACSERMPEDEQEVIVQNKMGYRYVSYFDEHSGLFFDMRGGNQMNCIEHIFVTHWMPMPAAPQQEVTQALAKGMERYGDAMQKLADSGD